MAVTVEMLKERLKDIAYITEDIEEQTERVEVLRDKMTSVSAPILTGMPKNPSPDPDHMTMAIYKITAIEEDIKQKQRKLLQEMDWIESVISYLKTGKERCIIRYKYIDMESWNDTFFHVYGGEEDFTEREDTYNRKMYATHKKALQKMVDAINKYDLWK